jgi:hypothetical protein
MKTSVTSSFRRSAVNLAGGLVTLAAGIFSASVAPAHLTYTGRDFGTFSGLTNGTLSITNQTCTGNYGWADAADGVLGDSHHGRGFRFRLENAAFVTLTVSANPAATATSRGDLTPAFSIYSGLAAVAPFPPSQTTNAPSADHDGTPASLAWRTWWVQQNINPQVTDESPTDGCWNSIGDFRIGGDGDLAGDFSQLSTLIYRGSAASTTSGGTVSRSFALPAGDYTIIIGGNDIANKTADTAALARGIAATLAVTPTPPLSIGQIVFVSWPSGTTANWVLQSATSLDPSNWSNVTNAPVVVDGQPGVLVDKAGAERYFRFNYVP